MWKQLTKNVILLTHFVAHFTVCLKYTPYKAVPFEVLIIIIDIIQSLDDKKGQKSTAPGIPKRSPIQVLGLIEPDVALLRGSDENRCIQRSMVVGRRPRKGRVHMGAETKDVAQSEKSPMPAPMTKVAAKSLQHPVFPSGLPSKY